MNKQQLYTFGGALLATTALSSAASALTWVRLASDNLSWVTTSYSIANTIFSTTATTANTVTMTPGNQRVAATFSNIYSANTAANTKFSVEITPTGAAFSTGTAALANANFLSSISGQTTFTTTISTNLACASAIGFGTQFVIDGCTAAITTNTNRSVNIGGLVFSGVTFTNASGLATVGGTVSLTGRVYNQTTGGNFEAAATGTIITSAAALSVAVTAQQNTTVSATTTPTAFTALSSSNITNSTLTMDLVKVTVTSTGALQADLSALATATTETSSATISVTSALLSSGALANVHILSTAGQVNNLTIANFSGGSATFQLADTALAGSFMVKVAFNGTSVIPQVSGGTATVVFGRDATNQAVGSATGTTAGTNQGGFRGEVNTFNASTNGPYSSYLRIHNNGGAAGTVTITIRNDDHLSGAVLGSSFTTASIMAGSTMQLSAAEMEGTTVSTKLPSGGANVPEASRVGSYTVNVVGPIVGYVQHILFDGQNVADLSSFRNGGATGTAAP